MTADIAELVPGVAHLPRHAGLLAVFRDIVVDDERWRWLELGCSLASARADEWSDLDMAVGHRPPPSGDVPVASREADGLALVRSLGTPTDVLVHAIEGWAPDVRRFAVEFDDGVQLDLVVMPAERRQGLPPGSIAIVDKDGHLARPWTPPVIGQPSATEAREWAMLGWWAVSDAVKYVHRRAWHEAIERIGEARSAALKLFAAAGSVPYPSFGLTSLLDHEPFALPASLDATYATPADPSTVVAALRAVCTLLADAAAGAGATLGTELDTPWAVRATARVRALDTSV